MQTSEKGWVVIVVCVCVCVCVCVEWANLRNFSNEGAKVKKTENFEPTLRDVKSISGVIL